MRKYKTKSVPVKYCAQCGNLLERKRFNGRLEDRSVFLRRKYCGLECAWIGSRSESVSLPGLRKRAIPYRGSVCAECGTTANIGIHHINGNPADNSKLNVLTLCGSCHTKWHWRHGKVMPKRARATCSVCGRGCRTHGGMCQKHYVRWRKYGDPLLTKLKTGQHSYRLVKVAV